MLTPAASRTEHASGTARLVSADIGTLHFDFAKAFWLWGMLIPGVALGPLVVTPPLALLSAVLAFVTLCVGHSVGLHRGIIHRTYETGPKTRAVLSYLFVLSGLGGPLSWARLHAVRDYWQSRADCPAYFAYRHSMAADFIWNLHLRFEPKDARAESKLSPDVLSDRWLRFLERTWPLHTLALALVFLAWLGPEAVVVCICSRIAAGILGHWAIGYASHKFGNQPHVLTSATESGTNNWLLGVISFGEGFHNCHHAFPWSARMGLGRWDFDLGWQTLRALRRVGVVRDLRSASHVEVS